MHPFQSISKMSMFTLAISCLTTSDLPWFVDLTFQVPMQYCCLQHLTLFPTPQLRVISALAQLLHSFWSNCPPLFPSSLLGTFCSVELTFGVMSFCLFILFMGFSRQEYCSGLPFPPPVDHVLSERSTVTCPSWVALHSFIELHKSLHHDKAVTHERVI